MEAAPVAETRKWDRALLAAIFALAFGLRLLGIGWGLPNDLHNQSYHPDEQVILSQALQIEPAKLDFSIGFYNYGTFYLTLLKVASDVVAGYGGGPKPNDPKSLWDYVGRCHLAGRVISASAGALASVFVFLAVRRFCNAFGAAIGAGMVALSPTFVVHSRFQTVDVLAACLLAGSLWMTVRIIDDERPERCAVLAGVLAGLSAGTKYTGALLILPVVLAVYLRSKDTKVGFAPTTTKAATALLLAFVIATPGAVFESGAFLRDFKFEMLHTSSGHGLVFAGVGSGFLYHVTNLIQGFGPVGLFLAFAGLVWGAIARERAVWLALAFFVPYFVLIGRAEVLFARYTLPLVVVGSFGLGWICGRGHQQKGWGTLLPATGLLGLGVALQITWGYTAGMVQTDPRDSVARQFQSLPDSDNLTIGLVSDPWFYSPALIPDSAIMRGQMPEQLKQMESAKPRVVRYLPSDPRERYDWDVRLLTESKPDFVVFSNFEVGPVARLSGQGSTDVTVSRFEEFHAELDRLYYTESVPTGAPLARRYGGSNLVEDMAYVRPVLYLWKRKP